MMVFESNKIYIIRNKKCYIQSSIVNNMEVRPSVPPSFQTQPVTGRGTGLDDEGLERKIEVIEEAIRINAPNKKDPIDVLAKVGGFEIGGMIGVMLAAASHRIPVVIDGFVSGATALIAYEIAPAVKDYMIASHLSVERGHSVVLDYIGLKPLLDLDMRLGEGTGAVLGISIVEAACRILNEMATFEGAGVSDRS
jgi:nicotinate-nucleotide--dimethylbenzimidazole phosphoribosyltransferase